MNNSAIEEKGDFLKGVVSIYRVNKETGERELWDRKENTITISGMQWVLEKMFGLYLDSDHGKSYEALDQDTNLITPDLNTYKNTVMGVDPNTEGYDVMEDDISANHFIQGFMIGTGGSGEDTITSKNTNYSFVYLRNPIPFQQTQSTLDSSIRDRYLGNMKNASNNFTNSYFIKKFDERPHIYHSWWRDGQKWDYVDPVTQENLGPSSGQVTKTNRIETYVQMKMSIDTENGDCAEWFSHQANSNATGQISELGLVAYDAKEGDKSNITRLYKKQIKRFLSLLFDGSKREDTDKQDLITLANEIKTQMDGIGIENYSQSNINDFMVVINTIAGYTTNDLTDGVIAEYQDSLSSTDSIEANALYTRKNEFYTVTDKFMDYMSASEFDSLSADEAQRIKLITYYTFNAIPIEKNWGIEIIYRIYAN